MNEKIAVIGLGYVGLPVAVALARKFDGVIGFDVSERRVDSLNSGTDWTGEISDEDLAASTLAITADPAQLAEASFLIVTVPTPIDDENRPDLSPIRSACELIGKRLRKGAIVVFESTVYPGVTDDICAPLLESYSGLKRGTDFWLGYSPERINPGDKIHRLETITKIVSAEDDTSLERVKAVYGAIIEAGLHIAPTIKVAEAAKVIENTQRDLNIALMNEISLIFDLMGIRTSDVLAAAGTKWNFLKFTPGLVGGHCIGVDPYYLTSAAERLGYRPDVILAGRRINDGMGAHVARKLMKLLIQRGGNPSAAKVGIFGLTFKEDVPDLRNSKVPDIVAELKEYGVEALIHDPHADTAGAEHEYGLSLSDLSKLSDLDGAVFAVPHKDYLDNLADIVARVKPDGVIIDIKSALSPEQVGSGQTYWSL
ncbi:nucleotide sugar dehydrogenase [Sphingorhabdus sp.]|jgi:UDP-N-acetyl-D-galactosamine dehydrogenase|uniref:nucleotide sugar dehydrogenase n=1 Tax=Sphingorhabdus sp. TaxID=1902408 RepID=UPI003BAEE5CB